MQTCFAFGSDNWPQRLLLLKSYSTRPATKLRQYRYLQKGTMNSIIHEIERIVETACASDSNIFGYSIWTHHITQVVVNARRLAPRFGADPEVVELAALLHDYAGIKDAALHSDHHVHGPIEAERILRTLGYPDAKIVLVKACIATHRASIRAETRSVDGECLATADAIAHMEHVPSLLYYTFVQQRMGVDEGAAWVKRKLQRSWQKISPLIQVEMQERYEAALKTLTVLEQST
jgi:uncharacterized protein